MDYLLVVSPTTIVCNWLEFLSRTIIDKIGPLAIVMVCWEYKYSSWLMEFTCKFDGSFPEVQQSTRGSVVWFDSVILMRIGYIHILVGGLEYFFIFPYIANDHPN